MYFVENHGGGDEAMLFIPLVVLLIFGYFRVDQIFGPRKSVPAAPRITRVVADPADLSELTDPDGRHWN